MKVKVGACDVEVLAMSPPLADAETACGTYNPRRKAIHIEAERTSADQAEILMHELLHAGFDCFALPKSRLTEEMVCTSLAPVLATIIRDNPGLLGLLHQALCNGKAIV